MIYIVLTTMLVNTTGKRSRRKVRKVKKDAPTRAPTRIRRCGIPCQPHHLPGNLG